MPIKRQPELFISLQKLSDKCLWDQHGSPARGKSLFFRRPELQPQQKVLVVTPEIIAERRQAFIR
jgi:hypothetical protein